MQKQQSPLWRIIPRLLACLLICKTVLSVVANYPSYLPPNFNSDFLRGREQSFFGSYQWNFNVHIISGPCTLILGMLLLNRTFLQHFPKWHRFLGRTQVILILTMVAPTGLWMAAYAESGFIAGVAFAGLAISTALCAVLGWRCAVNRRFAEHRIWMQRCFALLCAAVVQRVLGGLGTVTDVEFESFNTYSPWVSWLLPLAGLELARLVSNRKRGQPSAQRSS